MKTVIISGGSDGLGKSISRVLQPDYQVTILSPTENKLKKAAEELDVEYHLCDVSDYSQCERAVKAVQEKYGSVDCVIANAGLWIQDELDENDPDHMRRVIEVNGLGVMYLVKAALPTMKTQQSGQIITINSQAGLYAKAERTVYNFTKWGLVGFTKSLREEVAKYGIKVTDVYPGKMDTQMFSKLGIVKDMNDAVKTEDVAKVVKFVIDLPEEVTIPEVGIKHRRG